MTGRIVRHLKFVAMAALIAIATAACSGTTPGTATGTPSDPTTPPSITSTPGASTAADPLADIDPCSLLAPAVISQNQLQPDTSGTGPGDRFCRWQTAVSSHNGYSIAINVYDHAGLHQLNTAAFAVTDHPVGRHQGRLSKQTGGSACLVSMGVTNTSRVDVVGVDDSGQQDRSCVLATTVAPAVEQRLPSGTG
jgi:uncharacterized protein DUF3558